MTIHNWRKRDWANPKNFQWKVKTCPGITCIRRGGGSGLGIGSHVVCAPCIEIPLLICWRVQRHGWNLMCKRIVLIREIQPMITFDCSGVWHPDKSQKKKASHREREYHRSPDPGNLCPVLDYQMWFAELDWLTHNIISQRSGGGGHAK